MSDRMRRDPSRIKAMLRIVEFVWTSNTDLRLGQLLANAQGDDLYNVEDAKLYARLVQFYKVPGLVALAAEGDPDDDRPRPKPRRKARCRRVRRP